MVSLKVAVIGAGAGGQAIAADLSMKGHQVTLYNRQHPVEDIQIFQPLKRSMRVDLEGALSGSGRLAAVTNDIGEAVSAKDVIIVTVPAVGHEPLAGAMAPFLEAGQILLIHPAQIGSAWGIRRALGSVAEDINLVVTHSLLYACRAPQVGHVKVHGVKRILRCAALPASRTLDLMPTVQHLIPQAMAVRSALEAEISNINTVMHPAVVLCNMTAVENGRPFEFYKDGATDATARLVSALDKERAEIGRQLGLNPVSASQFLAEAYGVAMGPLGEMARNNPGFAGIPAPVTLNHRYVWEDVACGLTPLAALGSAVGVPTPMIEAVIAVLRAVVTDEITSNRTAEWLGIRNLSRDDVVRLALE